MLSQCVKLEIGFRDFIEDFACFHITNTEKHHEKTNR